MLRANPRRAVLESHCGPGEHRTAALRNAFVTLTAAGSAGSWQHRCAGRSAPASWHGLLGREPWGLSLRLGGSWADMAGMPAGICSFSRPCVRPGARLQSKSLWMGSTALRSAEIIDRRGTVRARRKPHVKAFMSNCQLCAGFMKYLSRGKNKICPQTAPRHLHKPMLGGALGMLPRPQPHCDPRPGRYPEHWGMAHSCEHSDHGQCCMSLAPAVERKFGCGPHSWAVAQKNWVRAGAVPGQCPQCCRPSALGNGCKAQLSWANGGGEGARWVPHPWSCSRPWVSPGQPELGGSQPTAGVARGGLRGPFQPTNPTQPCCGSMVLCSLCWEDEGRSSAQRLSAWSRRSPPLFKVEL